MNEVPQYASLADIVQSKAGTHLTLFQHSVSRYGIAHRATSLIRKRPPQDPTVGLYLGPYAGPRGGGGFL